MVIVAVSGSTQQAQYIAELLTDGHMYLAVAESCTGGMCAAQCTQYPGSSQWFAGGVIAYHDQIKSQLLAVPEATLAQYGAVSSQVAQAMALGVTKACNAQIGIGVTGIAGPGGATENKPVGSVYFAIVLDTGELLASKYLQLNGDREAVRARAVEHVMSTLLEVLTILKNSHKK
jgi:PncC family amidohydrolase